MRLKELATALGLSQTTVSRAINGYPEVSEATRARVMEAARRHNYQPNPRAKALATGRSMAIGHVIPLSTRHEMVNPVFADFIAGASEIYAREGYHIHMTFVSDDDEEQAYREIAAKGSVDGIIVHAPRADDGRIGLLSSVGLPFVVHGRATGIEETYNWVDVNNRRAFRRATEFLIDLGHRRIALLNGLETMEFAMRRRAGYLEALSARGLTPDPGLMLTDEMTERYGYQGARALLTQRNPPTAFLCSSIISAFGIRRAVDEVGLKLGRDVSVITHDDDLSYLQNGADDPIFTALRSSVREAGRRAAAILIGQIRAPGPPVHTLLEAEFLIGRSTAPVAQTASAINA
jgi:LacI family transcriptional regulator